MGRSIMSVIIGLALNLAVYFTAVNRRVDKWRWLTAADPCSVMLAISSAASSIANLGYREGGGARFHVLKQDGRPFDECDQEYARTTGAMEAIKSIFRGKALRISPSSTVFTLVCFMNPQLCNHVLRQGDVSIPFTGTADIHFTPNILSDELFGSEFAFLHPVLRAFQEMDVTRDIYFAGPVCESCTIVAPGFGWDSKCQVWQGEAFDFSNPVKNAVIPLLSIGIVDSWEPDGHSVLAEASFKETPGCTGRYTTRHCSLLPAVVNYYLEVAKDIFPFPLSRSCTVDLLYVRCQSNKALNLCYMASSPFA
ncbi:hypothetical protein QBC32DRAFT_118900 [Pseudoneurospora amorphoporcata]|uniref:Uncharacterized protein n=1 Tax=Pseudoneurospora amorphoporcata TaxID=241081 RepID=A0AAN6NJ68_9PEZI|nr:hypothetical protein QBC32DRAFT_118900 [Pseudoneurospora amorphoporcata]